MAGLYIDGDLWWASTYVTTVVGSGVIGKHFAENHYDYAYCYTWNYITQNGTNRIGIICPDGWRLSTINEFAALLKASGFTGSGTQTTSAGSVTNINGTGKNGRWLGPGVATGGSNANSYKYTTDTHIFIPFSGHSSSTNNAPGYSSTGTAVWLWSSSPAGSSSAYFLNLWNSTIQPLYSDNRTYGFPVRCVADPL